jgi:dienelactone hydrolase
MARAAVTSSFACLTLTLAVTCGDARAAPPPAEDFGELPRTSHVTISPSGGRIAWLNEAIAQPQVFVFDVDARKDVRVFRVDDKDKVRALYWVNDSVLIMLVGFTVQHGRARSAELGQAEIYRALACDADSGQMRELLPGSFFSQLMMSGVVFVSWHPAQPDTVIMAAPDLRRSGVKQYLYAVDVHTGKSTAIADGPPEVTQWVVDRGGAPVARSEVTRDAHVLSVLRREASGWKEFMRRDRPDGLSFTPISADGIHLTALGAASDGHVRLWSIGLDGSAPTSLLPDATEDVTDVIVDPLSGAAAAVQLGGLNPKVRWLEPSAERRQQVVAHAFPNRDVLVLGHSQNNARVVVAVGGPSSPEVYYLVDLTNHRADIVGEEYPTLAPLPLGEVRALTYAARDGSAIPAYLTLPPGGADKNLPLVVLVHGGPFERDDYPRFDWWAQFLATRGYAVLQPQYRGSTGFGVAFEHAGYRQWGGLMQDDVSDGVRALITQGVADPHHVCIVGASYGGYAALAGAAFTPELYACAASINGPSDLPEMRKFLEQRSHRNPLLMRFLDDTMGAAGDPALAAKSPARAAASIKAPILIIQSTQDTVVPPSQSDLMARAIRASGGDVTVVTLAGEDHWLSRSSTRIDMLKALDSFLAAHLH